MGITLKGLGEGAVEAQIIDDYISKGVDGNTALYKTLNDSFSKVFENSYFEDQKELHYTGITDCDAFDKIKTTFSKVSTTDVLIDKDNLIQEYLMQVFHNEEPTNDRFGIKLKIIPNNPSYIKMNFASTYSNDKDNDVLANKYAKRVTDAFAPYIVDPQAIARRVDGVESSDLKQILENQNIMSKELHKTYKKTKKTYDKTKDIKDLSKMALEQLLSNKLILEGYFSKVFPRDFKRGKDRLEGYIANKTFKMEATVKPKCPAFKFDRLESLFEIDEIEYNGKQKDVIEVKNDYVEGAYAVEIGELITMNDAGNVWMKIRVPNKKENEQIKKGDYFGITVKGKAHLDEGKFKVSKSSDEILIVKGNVTREMSKKIGKIALKFALPRVGKLLDKK